MEKAIIPVSHQISSSCEPQGVTQFSYNMEWFRTLGFARSASAHTIIRKVKGIVKKKVFCSRTQHNDPRHFQDHSQLQAINTN